MVSFSKAESQRSPLRYDDAYRLKKEFQILHAEINGGVKTHDDIESHLPHVDAV